MLTAIAHNSRVAVRSGHGVGKTALESWVILWFLFTRPFPKIPCTAPTQQQLLDILWPEISKWLKRSELMDELFDWQKTKIQNRIFPERWFATARTLVSQKIWQGSTKNTCFLLLMKQVVYRTRFMKQ